MTDIPIFQKQKHAWFDPRAILRDTLIVFGLHMVAGLLLVAMAFSANALGSDDPGLLFQIVAEALLVTLGSIGFGISAHWTPVGRWKHLAAVAIGVLLFLYLPELFETTLMDWVGGAFHLAVMMVLGGAASYLVKPRDNNVFKVS